MRLLRSLGSSRIIFIIIVLIFLVPFIPRNETHSKLYVPHPLLESEIKQRMLSVSDSMPAHQYRHIEDSIRRAVNEENVDLISTGNSWSWGPIGIATYEHEKRKDYFLRFSNYQTEPMTRFFRRNGKTYVEYVRNGKILTKETVSRHLSEDYSSDGELLVPTTAGVAKFCEIVIPSVGLILVAISFYMLFLVPMRILYNISRGKVFIDENIGGLHAMGWALLIFGVLPGIIGVIAHLIVKNQIPETVSFSYYDSLMTGSKWVIAGLSLLLLNKAFLNGSKLQQEQELTV